MQTQKLTLRNSSTLKSILAGSLTIFFPICIFFILRYLQRVVFEVVVGWPVGTDADFILPFIVMQSAFLFFLNAKVALPLRFQFNTLKLLLFSIISTVCCLFFYSALHFPIEGALKINIFLLGILSISISQFLFVSPSYFLKHPSLKFWPCFFLAGISLPFSKAAFAFVWPWMAMPTGKAVQWGSTLLLSKEVGLYSNLVGNDFYATVSMERFNVFIGSGCGGMDGVLLFLFCFGIYYIHNKEKSPLLNLFFLILGTSLILAVNIFRLIALFVGGFFLRKHQLVSLETFLFLIHSNLGWILYVAFLIPFFKCITWASKVKGREIIRSSFLQTEKGFGT